REESNRSRDEAGNSRTAVTDANSDNGHGRSSDVQMGWSRGTQELERDIYQNRNQWLTESPLCGANDGVSHRMDRLRALGNAIVPQVATQIMQAMREAA